ncbi:MAG TPA: acyltransferase [Devosiaceae bacterium]|nr:acyltransferase [Devosiaceae bacterium]
MREAEYSAFVRGLASGEKFQDSPQPADHSAPRLSVALPIPGQGQMMQLSARMAEFHYRGPGFDRIRVLAALTVVVHHCSLMTIPITHDFLYEFSWGVTNTGNLAVAIFFATSGALVVPGLLRGGDIGIFAINRFMRIMPALVATVLVTIFVLGPVLTRLSPMQYLLDPHTYAYLNNIIFRASHTLPGVTLADGTGVLVNGSLWTLYFEVLSYVALAVAFKAGLLISKRACLSLLVVVYALNAACWFSPTVHDLIPDRIVVFLSLFVYFMAGAAFHVLADKVPYNAVAAVIAGALLLVSMPLGLGILTLPVLLPYLVVCLGFSGFLGKKPLPVDLSYGIYLNHALAITVLSVLFPWMCTFFTALPVVALSAVVLAAISWRFVEAPSLASKGFVCDFYREWKGRFQLRRRKVAAKSTR